MIDWDSIKLRVEELARQLADLSLDPEKRKDLQKQYVHYSEMLELHNEIVEIKQRIKEHEDQLKLIEDSEMQLLFEEEIEKEKKKLDDLHADLNDLLYPPDPRDSKSVFLEIRAGAGGQEASLFAADLMKMYTNYALSKGWQVSVTDFHPTEVGGYKEVILYVKGKNVYKYLKFESGVHRVQRVPKTESSGRIHTSTVTVAVLPEADEVDVQINPADLRIDVFRASGAGGQHVNTTDSAVRITHIPTGIVVTCQDERSQIKNKAKAMKVLRARLLEAEEEKRLQEMGAARKEQVGTGERAEKIRTYNFPQNRVTDHRINLTLKKLDVILEGDLDDLIKPLLEEEVRKRQLKVEAKAK